MPLRIPKPTFRFRPELALGRTSASLSGGSEADQPLSTQCGGRPGSGGLPPLSTQVGRRLAREVFSGADIRRHSVPTATRLTPVIVGLISGFRKQTSLRCLRQSPHVATLRVATPTHPAQARLKGGRMKSSLRSFKTKNASNQSTTDNWHSMPLGRPRPHAHAPRIRGTRN